MDNWYVYYPLVNIQTTMENHHFQWVNPLWPFNSKLLVITRVLASLAILWMGSWQLEEQEMLTIQSTGKVLKNLFVPLKEAREEPDRLPNCVKNRNIAPFHIIQILQQAVQFYISTFNYVHAPHTNMKHTYTYYIHTDICIYPCMIMICRYKLQREREIEIQVTRKSCSSCFHCRYLAMFDLEPSFPRHQWPDSLSSGELCFSIYELGILPAKLAGLGSNIVT